MSTERTVLQETTSLCPACLERVPGRYEVEDERVHLTRECPDHGTTSREVWGSVDHWQWAHDVAGDTAPDPDPDGEFVVDNDHACLAVIEVTEDCNLSCSYCFASSGPGGDHRSVETIVDLLEVVKQDGGARPIQFSGGEPTVRDDLPALVETATDMGFDHIQVNTNGIRLATEDGYARQLVEAGVTAIYLQFDGLTAETYEAIREVDLTEHKHAAIEACRAADLPVVLVPTIVPGVNDHEMGDIVRFGLDNLDIVESINFQPVAHFGRFDEHNGRFSLDRAAQRLAEDIEAMGPRDLLPIPCCSSTCQMATVLKPDGDGGVIPLTSFVNDELFDSLSGMVNESDWMELLACTTAGQDRACSVSGCCGGTADLPIDAGALLESVLPVSLTGFMDADAADAGKLSNCCVSVPTETGELVPFCAYNMTTADGRYAIRNRKGWGGRTGVGPSPPDASVADAETGRGTDRATGSGEGE
ncbi:MAG: radical SAM protein [Halobacteriales archaeon]|nr:radical SAM protein [Halobacteriales archaeon]